MQVATAVLCVFVRAPNLGQVKSRLASSIGAAAALAAHIELVEHLLGQLDTTRLATPPRFEVQLWLGDRPLTASAEAQILAWEQRTKQSLRHQQGENLGARMHHALTQCTVSGRYGLLVGSDCPTIDSVYVDQALAALSSGADVVLGPAEDGGYGLVGLAHPQPALFEGVSWGTDKVLEQTLANAAQASLRVQLLDSLWDVDYTADWERYCQTYRKR